MHIIFIGFILHAGNLRHGEKQLAWITSLAHVTAAEDVRSDTPSRAFHTGPHCRPGLRLNEVLNPGGVPPEPPDLSVTGLQPRYGGLGEVKHGPSTESKCFPKAKAMGCVVLAHRAFPGLRGELVANKRHGTQPQEMRGCWLSCIGACGGVGGGPLFTAPLKFGASNSNYSVPSPP